jgi:hypothetical protein
MAAYSDIQILIIYVLLIEKVAILFGEKFVSLTS